MNPKLKRLLNKNKNCFDSLENLLRRVTNKKSYDDFKKSYDDYERSGYDVTTFQEKYDGLLRFTEDFFRKFPNAQVDLNYYRKKLDL